MYAIPGVIVQNRFVARHDSISLMRTLSTRSVQMPVGPIQWGFEKMLRLRIVFDHIYIYIYNYRNRLNVLLQHLYSINTFDIFKLYTVMGFMYNIA